MSPDDTSRGMVALNALPAGYSVNSTSSGRTRYSRAKSAGPSTPVARTRSYRSRSSNTTSSVISNGPAFLLLHALAISRMRGTSDRLVFDGKGRAGIVDRHGVKDGEAIGRRRFDVGRRVRKGHVALLAEASRKIDVQHLN